MKRIFNFLFVILGFVVDVHKDMLVSPDFFRTEGVRYTAVPKDALPVPIITIFTFLYKTPLCI